MTHPRPLPGQTRRGLPPVEEGLGRGREQGVLEEGTMPQAGPPQRVEVLSLEAVDSFRHGSCSGATSGTEDYQSVIIKHKTNSLTADLIIKM